ncbi:mediator of RNA polymerase II transcription subunit 11 [Tanacetum coccineum]
MFGRFFPVKIWKLPAEQAALRPIPGDMSPGKSLGKVARERIPGELSPSTYPGRHVARDKYPQRHVAREGVKMSLGIVRIVRVLELAGGVMEEFLNPSRPRKELDIQVTLREEIKSACEYRLFEKCDYIARISNEICRKKMEYVLEKLDGMKEMIDEYHQAG